MRKTRLIVLAVIMLVLLRSATHAATLSEDVTYWFKTANGSDSIMNPTTDWLKHNDANLLVKVQQSVMDMQDTMDALNRLSPGLGTAHPGYLYSYSVTNLGIGDLKNLADMGITSFHAEWNSPYYATVSHQTPTGWAVDTTSPESASGPIWKWTPVDPGVAGILKNETVGGFWAVSNVGIDGQIKASILHGGPNGITSWGGTTTGPFVPEPSAYLSLIAGLSGLGMMAKLRRRK